MTSSDKQKAGLSFSIKSTSLAVSKLTQKLGKAPSSDATGHAAAFIPRNVITGSASAAGRVFPSKELIKTRDNAPIKFQISPRKKLSSALVQYSDDDESAPSGLEDKSSPPPPPPPPPPKLSSANVMKAKQEYDSKGKYIGNTDLTRIVPLEQRHVVTQLYESDSDSEQPKNSSRSAAKKDWRDSDDSPHSKNRHSESNKSRRRSRSTDRRTRRNSPELESCSKGSKSMKEDKRSHSTKQENKNSDNVRLADRSFAYDCDSMRRNMNEFSGRPRSGAVERATSGNQTKRLDEQHADTRTRDQKYRAESCDLNLLSQPVNNESYMNESEISDDDIRHRSQSKYNEVSHGKLEHTVRRKYSRQDSDDSMEKRHHLKKHKEKSSIINNKNYSSNSSGASPIEGEKNTRDYIKAQDNSQYDRSFVHDSGEQVMLKSSKRPLNNEMEVRDKRLGKNSSRDSTLSSSQRALVQREDEFQKSANHEQQSRSPTSSKSSKYRKEKYDTGYTSRYAHENDGFECEQKQHSVKTVVANHCNRSAQDAYDPFEEPTVQMKSKTKSLDVSQMGDAPHTKSSRQVEYGIKSVEQKSRHRHYNESYESPPPPPPPGIQNLDKYKQSVSTRSGENDRDEIARLSREIAKRSRLACVPSVETETRPPHRDTHHSSNERVQRDMGSEKEKIRDSESRDRSKNSARDLNDKGVARSNSSKSIVQRVSVSSSDSESYGERQRSKKIEIDLTQPAKRSRNEPHVQKEHTNKRIRSPKHSNRYSSELESDSSHNSGNDDRDSRSKHTRIKNLHSAKDVIITNSSRFAMTPNVTIVDDDDNDPDISCKLVTSVPVIDVERCETRVSKSISKQHKEQSRSETMPIDLLSVPLPAEPAINLLEIPMPSVLTKHTVDSVEVTNIVDVDDFPMKANKSLSHSYSDVTESKISVIQSCSEVEMLHVSKPKSSASETDMFETGEKDSDSSGMQKLPGKTKFQIVIKKVATLPAVAPVFSKQAQTSDATPVVNAFPLMEKKLQKSIAGVKCGQILIDTRKPECLPTVKIASNVNNTSEGQRRKSRWDCGSKGDDTLKCVTTSFDNRDRNKDNSEKAEKYDPFSTELDKNTEYTGLRDKEVEVSTSSRGIKDDKAEPAHKQRSDSSCGDNMKSENNKTMKLEREHHNLRRSSHHRSPVDSQLRNRRSQSNEKKSSASKGRRSTSRRRHSGSSKRIHSGSRARNPRTKSKSHEHRSQSRSRRRNSRDRQRENRRARRSSSNDSRHRSRSRVKQMSLGRHERVSSNRGRNKSIEARRENRISDVDKHSNDDQTERDISKREPKNDHDKRKQRDERQISPDKSNRKRCFTPSTEQYRENLKSVGCRIEKAHDSDRARPQRDHPDRNDNSYYDGDQNRSAFAREYTHSDLGEHQSKHESKRYGSERENEHNRSVFNAYPDRERVHPDVEISESRETDRVRSHRDSEKEHSRDSVNLSRKKDGRDYHAEQEECKEDSSHRNSSRRSRRDTDRLLEFTDQSNERSEYRSDCKRGSSMVRDRDWHLRDQLDHDPGHVYYSEQFKEDSRHSDHATREWDRNNLNHSRDDLNRSHDDRVNNREDLNRSRDDHDFSHDKHNRVDRKSLRNDRSNRRSELNRNHDDHDNRRDDLNRSRDDRDNRHDDLNRNRDDRDYNRADANRSRGDRIHDEGRQDDRDRSYDDRNERKRDDREIDYDRRRERNRFSDSRDHSDRDSERLDSRERSARGKESSPTFKNRNRLPLRINDEYLDRSGTDSKNNNVIDLMSISLPSRSSRLSREEDHNKISPARIRGEQNADAVDMEVVTSDEEGGHIALDQSTHVSSTTVSHDRNRNSDMMPPFGSLSTMMPVVDSTSMLRTHPPPPPPPFNTPWHFNAPPPPPYHQLHPQYNRHGYDRYDHSQFFGLPPPPLPGRSYDQPSSNMPSVNQFDHLSKKHSASLALRTGAAEATQRLDSEPRRTELFERNLYDKGKPETKSSVDSKRDDIIASPTLYEAEMSCVWEAIPQIIDPPSAKTASSLDKRDGDTSFKYDATLRSSDDNEICIKKKRRSFGSDTSSPTTARRRSSRIQTLEDKKDVEKENISSKNSGNDESSETSGRAGDLDSNRSISGTNLKARILGEYDPAHGSSPGGSSGATSDDNIRHSEFARPDGMAVRRDCSAGEEMSPMSQPMKMKSRWRRWSELESDGSRAQSELPTTASYDKGVEEGGDKIEIKAEEEAEVAEAPYFEEITENIFLSERDKSKARKEARRMLCDCTLPFSDDYKMGARPCGDDCLNRMLMIECGTRCPCGEKCTNRLFQRREYAKSRSFQTHWKGWGLQAAEDMEPGTFVMEYVGEVLNYAEFKYRTKKYARENATHHYFMALSGDEVIDASKKGNISRFINHSCDPNAETQKWTVNGQLRVGFFAIKPIKAGEEITFNYQFENYGEVMKCFCGASNCRGIIGSAKSTPLRSIRRYKAKNRDKKKRSELFSDLFLEEEIDKMLALKGLHRKDHVLELNRLMLRAETVEQRISLLRVIQATKEPACLRLFLEYQGLPLLWSWMVDARSSDSEFKSQTLKTLKLLPITNITILRDSKILSVVEKWSQEIAATASTEQRKAKKLKSQQQKAITETVQKNDDESSTAASVDGSSVVDEQVTDTPMPGQKTAEKGSLILKLHRGRVLRTSCDNSSDMSGSESDSNEQLDEPKQADDDDISQGGDDVTETEPHAVTPADTPAETISKEIVMSRIETTCETKEENLIVSDNVAALEPVLTENDILTQPLGVASDCASAARELRIHSLEDDQDVLNEGDSNSQASSALDDVTTVPALSETLPEPAPVERLEAEDSMVVEVIAGSVADDASDIAEEEDDEDEEDRTSKFDGTNALATDLLSCWKSLKEAYKIPKKLVEERKKTEEELDKRSEEHDSRREEQVKDNSYSGWADRKRSYDDGSESRYGADKRRRSTVDERRQSFDRGDDNKTLKNRFAKPSFKNVGTMGVTTPGISKQQRRQMFEAQVKAMEESQQKSELESLQSQQSLPDSTYQGYYATVLPGTNPSSITIGYAADPNAPVTGIPVGYQGQATVYPGATTVLYTTGAYYQSAAAPSANYISQEPVVQTQLAYHTVEGYPTGTQQPQQQSVLIDASCIQYQPITAGYMQQTITAGYVDPAAQTVFATTIPSQYVPQQQQEQLYQSQEYSQTVPSAPGGTVVMAYVSSPPASVASSASIVPPPRDPRDPPPPPPPSPPKPKERRLPLNWRCAKDAQGKVYYYHTVTRQTQWEPPMVDGGIPDEDGDDAGDTPTNDERKPSSRRKTTTAAADTSSEELAKKIKEQFRARISKHIISYLNPYHKIDCEQGRIIHSEDFKHLARKITHAILNKELKQCRYLEDLEVNENVKGKAKDFVTKYMSKFGAVYNPTVSP